MPEPIDLILREWIAPLLKANGFKKNARRSWVRDDGDGNLAYVTIVGSDTSDWAAYRFFFEVGITPASRQRYLNDVDPDSKHNIHSCWWTRLTPPEPVEDGVDHFSRWVCDNHDVDGQALTGRVMRKTLEVWIPKLLELSTPANMLAYLEQNEPLTPGYQAWVGPAGAHADLFLLLDAGPSERLDRAIAGVQGDRWVREWLDQQSGRTGT
ncbi:hypothetical protein ABLG96_01805 [Nakamurella sp. A5-74]|uniref:DUF4304 domain-containing protein n=1 Tax=Nakamurella sp. A5-74 TaxID=3158264 RepID=A0AAU8DPL9_9ACTN